MAARIDKRILFACARCHRFVFFLGFIMPGMITNHYVYVLAEKSFNAVEKQTATAVWNVTEIHIALLKLVDTRSAKHSGTVYFAVFLYVKEE